MLSALAVAAVTLILTCVAIPLVKWVAVRWGFVDRPGGLLKPQARAIPYGGGVAVAIGVGGALLWTRPGLPLITVIGAAIVLLLGIADDAVSVRPLWRLVVELFAGSTLLALWPFSVAQWSTSAALAGTCCAILASASMNAYNMTDGIDGLSGTVGLFAVGGLLTGWLLGGNSALVAVAAASCGGIVGFVIFNWPPARVYLGDSGAYLMGFLLAALCIPALTSPWATVGVICIMAPLELELSASVIRRIVGHRRLMEGDRRHVYDVLRADGGRSARSVVGIYAGVGAVSSLIGVLVWNGFSVVLGILWVVLLGSAVIVLYRKSGSRKAV